jgi:hypothetical protein
MNEVFFDNVMLSALVHIGAGYLVSAAVMGYIVFLLTIKANIKENKIPTILGQVLIIIHLIVAFFGVLVVPSLLFNNLGDSDNTVDALMLSMSGVGMLACIFFVITFWKKKIQDI